MMTWAGKCHDCGLLIPHLYWCEGKGDYQRKYWICVSCIPAWKPYVHILALADCNVDTGRLCVIDGEGFELKAENVFVGGTPV